MPRVHRVERARKPNAVVTAQDIEDAKSGKRPDAASYYHWSFRYGGKHVSKTYPKQSQLTQSEFLGAIYGLAEDLEALSEQNSFEEIREAVEDAKSTLEEQRDECESKRDSMPYQLQDSETGELLEQRGQYCEEMIQELDGIEIPGDDEAREEVLPEAEAELPDEEDIEDREAYLDNLVEEKLNERKQQVIDEIQAVEYQGE